MVSIESKNSEHVSLLERRIAGCSEVFDLLRFSGDDWDAKIGILDALPNVNNFFNSNQILKKLFKTLPREQEYAVKALIGIDQGPQVFYGWNKDISLESLIHTLVTVEELYQSIGGIVGYHLTTLKLIYSELTGSTNRVDGIKMQMPPYVDIRNYSKEVAKEIVNGIEAMTALAEIYVVGGAGERLHLMDERAGMPLPVARLAFCGKSLLEGLFRDLEAREYLFYQLTGSCLCTPVVLMTSCEKRNDEEIAALLREKNWFGRPQESIIRMPQPLVPVLTVEGDWAVTGPGALVLKPGGHGVLWALAERTRVFDMLQKKGRECCLVRQINNPLAGLDYNLLVLAGYGYARKKAFGFESCPRQQNMTEGMNVLKITPLLSCAISNVEYTEFARRAKSDPSFEKLLQHGDMPANTNILYANIAQVTRYVQQKLPIPGLIVNMKNKVHSMSKGQPVEIAAARLESTMQNIADGLTDTIEAPVTAEKLSTFVLLNKRQKSMSTTKKQYDGVNVSETPESCFYDLVQENRRLLEYCGYQVPEMNSLEEYLKRGPSLLFLYHPALGPLYSIIAQKLSQGRSAPLSELQLEIAEVRIVDLVLDGSLLVTAKQSTRDDSYEFSPHVGRLFLDNVRVQNRGIDREAQNCYWKNEIQRKEAVHIVLEGNAEFFAQDITLHGAQEIYVPAGKRARVRERDGEVDISFEEIENGPGWQWRYSQDEENEIRLRM